MRLTIVIAGLGGGGAERVVVNLAHTWAARGDQVAILTMSQRSRPSAYPVNESVAHHDLGWPRVAREYELNPRTAATISYGLHVNNSDALIHDITMLAVLRFAILNTNPDVVVSFVTQTNVRVLAALHASNVPVIACEVSDTRRIWLRDWARPRDNFYRRAAAVVACDPVIADWLAQRGARATAIHNPLLPPDPLTTSPSHSRKRVITLSRLSIEKRPEWLVRAFASLAERYPDWDLEIYGDGPQRNFLEHLAENLAPPGRIKLCGFTGNAYRALAGADIFVSASWIEGYGNAIWEALASGVPVVAIDAGPSIGRLVRHEIDGLVVRGESAGWLATALERVMKNDAEREKFAARAPEVVERFSMQAALQQWDELLSPFRTHSRNPQPSADNETRASLFRDKPAARSA